MLIAVASTKGGAGVTSFALALAAVWPGEAAVVIEADCAGGDLGARHWLADSPGVATLATQSRTGSVTLDQHLTRLPCGVDVILAAAGRHPATVAVGLLVEADIGLWAKQRPTIADVGRLEPGAPSAALVERADVLLMVSRGDEGSLLRLADAGPPTGHSRLVLVGHSTYSGTQIAQRTGLDVAVRVPWDMRAAEIVAGQRTARGGWTRRGLPAAARALATSIATPPADQIAGGAG
jgi:hypothetical protein